MMTENYNIFSFNCARIRTVRMIYCLRGDRMRKYAWLSAIVVTLLLPYFAYRIAEDMVLSQPETTQVATTVPTAPSESQQTIVRVQLTDGSVLPMDLETYVGRVLLAEMPLTFDVEALKAQAVAVRTYTLKRMDGGSKHEGADVCTSAVCCQAYVTPEEYVLQGGKEALLYKVEETLKDTKAQVMTYDGSLIEATYFSSSGGSTEDAVAVWGAEVPYLRAQPSPDEGDKKYLKTVTFSAAEFCDLLDLTEMPESIGDIAYTSGGGVASIQIGNQTFSGIELRKKLSLASTAFLITKIGDSVTITTKGNGHRVGLSQYGAEAMAVAGRTYYEILEYYYPGAKLIALE